MSDEYIDAVKQSYYDFRKATNYDQRLQNLRYTINELINYDGQVLVYYIENFLVIFIDYITCRNEAIIKKKKERRDKRRAQQEMSMKQDIKDIEKIGRTESLHRLLVAHLQLLCSLNMTQEVSMDEL